MQVPTPWDEDLCFALAIMLNRCGSTSLIEVHLGAADSHDCMSVVVVLLISWSAARLLAGLCSREVLTSALLAVNRPHPLS